MPESLKTHFYEKERESFSGFPQEEALKEKKIYSFLRVV
jgi:hypothetical protein